MPLGDAAGIANGVAIVQQLSPEDLLVDEAIRLIDAAADDDQQPPPTPPSPLPQQQQQQPQQQLQIDQLLQPVAPVVTSIDAAASVLLNATQPVGRTKTFTGDLLEELRSRVRSLFELYYSLSEEQVAHEALDVILQSNLSDEAKLQKIQHV